MRPEPLLAVQLPGQGAGKVGFALCGRQLRAAVSQGVNQGSNDLGAIERFSCRPPDRTGESAEKHQLAIE